MKNTNSTQKGFSFKILFSAILFFAISFSMQSQTVSKEESIQSNSIEIASSKSSRVNTSDFEFVSWFMGTKQNINPIESTEEATTKKMLINARVAPNRTLMKAFLKKAQNQTSSLA